MSQQDWEACVEKHKQLLKPKVYAEIASVLDYNTFQATLDDRCRTFHNKTSVRIIRGMDTTFSGLQGFVEIVSVMVQSNPAIASLVWGSVLFIITLVRRSVKVLNGIADCLGKMGTQIPILQRYRKLFPDSDSLRGAILSVYDAYTTFLVQSILYFQRNTAVTLLESIAWPRAENEFSKCHQKISDVLNQFESEASISTRETLVPAARQIDGISQKLDHVHIIQNTARCSTVDIPHNDFFGQREHTLTRLHDLVRPGQQSMRQCTIYGMPGVGKTSVAVEYTYRYQSEYKYIFWLRAEDATVLARSYEDIIRKLTGIVKPTGNSLRDKELVREHLSTTREDWLLIFDNVSNMNVIRSYMPANVNGSVIITTQSMDVHNAAKDSIEVKPLDREEGASLLLDYLGGTTHKREDALTVSDLVGGHPLALAQVAGSVKGYSTLEEYIRLYGETLQNVEELSKAGNLTHFYQGTLETVFDIALSALVPDARKLLDILAMLNPDSIHEDMFFRQHSDASLLFLNSAPHLAKLRKNLQERHLTERRPLASGLWLLSIHRTLKQNLLFKLGNDPARFQTTFDQAFHIVRAAIPPQSPISSPSTDAWPLYDKYLPHALSLRAIVRSEGLGQQSPLTVEMGMASLLCDVSNYMWEALLMEDIFGVLEVAESICDQVLPSDSTEPIRTQVMFVRASCELDNGSLMRRAGVDRKQKILELRERHVSSSPTGQISRADDLQLSTAHNNLGCAWMQAEDFEAAKQYFNTALDMKKRWGTETTPDLISGFAEEYKNLALVALSQGDIQEAGRLSDQAVKIAETRSALETSYVQFHRYMRACIRYNAGDLTQALQDNVEILSIRRKYLGEANDETLDSYYAVGMMSFHANKLDEAKHHLEKCLSHRADYFSTRLPRCMHYLGLVHAALGDDQNADLYRKEARTLANSLVPPDCPGVDHGWTDEGLVYEQMVSIWAGRFDGKLKR